MRSIGQQTSNNEAHDAYSVGEERRVLPRVLRKPIRLVQRIATGGFHLRRSGMLAIALGAMVIGGSFHASRDDNGAQMLASLSQASGFVIGEIRISGNREIHREHIRAELADAKNASILSYDVHAARKRLNELAWVEKVNVTKVYPDTLAVDVVEREAFAVWQRNEQLFLVERDGDVIIPFDEKFSHLPLVVGEGANQGAADFITAVRRFPGLMARSKAFMRVAERRWDIRLENGVTVMLPEGDPAPVLARFEQLERKNSLTGRDLEAIDFRLEGKMVLRLTDDAVKRREAAITRSENNQSERQI